MPKPVVVPTPQSLAELVGRELAVSDWFAVTQERIQQFADATQDRQWIHTDRERAEKESPYGTTVAHGFLTLSLLSHLRKQAIHIEGGVRMATTYGLNRVRFPAPVRAGSKLRARFALQSLREVPGALEAVYHATIEVQDAEKPCCVAEWIVRYYP